MVEGNPILSFLRFVGQRATIDCRGVKRFYRRRRKEDDIRSQCKAEFCARCFVFGHDSTGCVANYSRCGGTSRIYYLDACQVSNLGAPAKPVSAPTTALTPLSYPQESFSSMAELFAPAEVSPSFEAMETCPSSMTVTSSSASAVRTGTPPSYQLKNLIPDVSVIGGI